MSQNGQEIVITGAGMITCLGLDRETTWRAVQAGRCGMGPLTAME
jgi:3-oxoacyl-[acyl-carrier-protein] synthase II